MRGTTNSPAHNVRGSYQGCWEWTGPRAKEGHGRVWWDNKRQFVHRLVYDALIGPIPHGLNVLHKCDNPPCFNPSHLYIGTQRQNRADCKDRGRMNCVRGEQHGRSKLTESEVLRIRYLHSLFSIKEISQIFKISRQNVGRIINRKIWTHV